MTSESKQEERSGSKEGEKSTNTRNKSKGKRRFPPRDDGFPHDMTEMTEIESLNNDSIKTKNNTRNNLLTIPQNMDFSPSASSSINNSHSKESRILR